MLKSKKFLFTALFLVLSLFLVACGDDNDDTSSGNNGDNTADREEVDGEASDRDEVIVGVGAEIPSLDPHGENMTSASQVFAHVFSTLVNQTPDMEIVPNLATDWEQIDDLTWEFNLREDVYFHSGDKMTAHDVAFSFARAATAPKVAPVMGMIDGDAIEIIDDYTIRIATEEPFAPLLAHLAHNASAIMNSELLADVAPGDAIGDLIDGTGPYRVIENISGNRLVMERWDDYHGELPNMRLITFRIMPDAPARGLAIETADIDIALNPAAADIARLSDHPELMMLSIQGLGTEYIALNNQHPQLSNRLVRQAINYAIDTVTMVDVISEGAAIPARGFIVPNAFGHNPDFEAYPFDIERARELMIEAGFSGESGANDVTFEIVSNSESIGRMTSAEIIQSQLREIGINVQIQNMEFGAMNDALADRELDAATLGWGTVTGDADYALFPLFHSSAHSPGTNHALFENAEFDRLIEAARSTMDADARLAYYTQAQEILREEAPWILVSNSNLWVPTRNDVRGLELYPHQAHFFGNVYFAE